MAGSALRRQAGPVGLTFASVTSMIGSGWLFGAYHAAQLAGPYSLLSWLLGAVIILVIALCFAELATIFPRSGALVHMSHASHGEGLGRAWSWLLVLAYVPIPAVEAEAIVTYANNYLPYFIQPQSGGLLTATGLATAACLLLVFALINLMSIRWLLNLNSTITWWKVFVPLATVVGLIIASFHPENFSAAPGSYSLTGVLTALPAAGVVFSFLGFRTAIDLAGESANPSRSLPLAVVGSIALATLVYLGLQIAFIVAVSPSELAGGWSSLSFEGNFGPFAGLAATLGLGWMAALLYIDAYVSPGGTGLMFVTGGSRILMANGEIGAGPRFLTILSRFRVPWLSVLIMWIAGCLFLLPFPAWQQMVSYISSITILTYGLAPVALLCLRQRLPDYPRPFRLPAAWLLAPLAFISSNWVIYWAGFDTNRFLFALIAAGFVVYAFFYHVVARRPADQFGWPQLAWLAPWFGGMWTWSALGGIGNGYGVLSLPVELIVIAVWSLLVMAAALATSLDSDDMRAVIDRVLNPVKDDWD